jgi:hypothetical protein
MLPRFNHYPSQKMKLLLPIAAILMAGFARLSAAETETTTTTQTESNGDYSVLKICQSDYTLKTDDGADAGRIEYVVLDPSEGRIVSAVITGGVLAERFVAVPFTAIRLGPSREVTLVKIDRAHLMDAQPIEREHIVNVHHFAPDVVRRTYAHFGMSENVLRNRRGPEDRIEAHDPNLNVGRGNFDNHQNKDRQQSDQHAQRDQRNQRDPNQNAVQPQRHEGSRNDQARSENNQQANRDQKGQANRNENSAQQRSKTHPNDSSEERKGRQVDGPRDEAAPKPGDRPQDAPPSAKNMKKDQADSPPGKRPSDQKNEEQSGSATAPQKKTEQKSKGHSPAESQAGHEKNQSSSEKQSSSDEHKEATPQKSKSEEATPQNNKTEHHPSAERGEGKAQERKGPGSASKGQEGESSRKGKKPPGE